MDPGSVGTSLHFDGHDLQSLQEAEYRKEEEEQQSELRKILTNAFDLMDEDILSETSEECDSHDGSSYKPDASFNNDGDGNTHQEFNRHSGGNNFDQIPNQNGGFQLSQTQKYVHNHQPDYHPNHQPNHQPDYQPNHQLHHQQDYHPKLQQDYHPNHDQINSEQIYQSRKMGSREMLDNCEDEFHRSNQALGELRTSGNHDQLTQNMTHGRNPTDYAQSLGYSSLPTDVNHVERNYNNNQPQVEDTVDTHFKPNEQPRPGNYYPYSNTPEPLPQTNSAGNGYFTENRYTLEAGRSSLDISYPNHLSFQTDIPTEPKDFGRPGQNFNPDYQSDNYHYQHYSTGQQQSQSHSNENFEPQIHSMANHESLPRNSSDNFQVRSSHTDVNQMAFTNSVPTNPHQQFDPQPDTMSHSRQPEIQNQHQQYSINGNNVQPSHHTYSSNLHENMRNTGTNNTDIPRRAQQYSHEEESLPKDKYDTPYMESYSNDEIAQLKILNKARAHELEELSAKYETLKQDDAREMRIIKHQMTLMEEEKERMKTENRQIEDSNQNLTDENRHLNSDVQRLTSEMDNLKDVKGELMKKLNAAEASIENLNVQLIETQLSDTHNRNRQQHEMMINGLQQKFEQEQTAMAEKLEKAYQIINEKEEAIDSLNKDLQEERIRASLIENNEILRHKGHDKTEEICRSLQMEIQDLKDHIHSSHSKSSSRLGAYSKSTQVLDHIQDDSMVDLGIRKTLHFNSTPNISHIDDHTQEKILTLETEIENIQVTNRKKQQHIDLLQRDLMNANSHIDILRKTMASNEQSRKEDVELEKRLEEMVENEEKLTEINNDLNHKLAHLEDAKKDLVDRREFEKNLKELDNVKEMYIAECEDRSKLEKKLNKEFEEKMKQTTEAFTTMETEFSEKIKELQELVSAKEEAINEMKLENLTKKYSKDKVDSSFIDNLHTSSGEVKHQQIVDADSGLPNNIREKSRKEVTSDDSRDSSNFSNSGLFTRSRNITMASDSFEKSDNDSMRSNKSRPSSVAGKAIEDLKRQHKSEIAYVRRALIEENKKMSIELHQKMMEMRDGYKHIIKKIKHEFRLEKEAILANFEKKQKQAFLKCTKPDVKLMVELGSQYMDAVKNIKSALAQHIHETNQRAAEKIKRELGQERINQMEKIYKNSNFDGTLQGFL